VRILISVGHPAHVHLFRNAIAKLRSDGHDIAVAAVRKESTIALLRHYKIDYEEFGIDREVLLQKALDVPLRDLNLLRFASDVKPDIIVSTGSPYAAQVSKVLGVPHIAFGDTEIARTVAKLMIPFTDAICTPSSFYMDLGQKHVKYNGYHEIAYLHPNYYKPNASILDEIGIKQGESYSIVRLASWTSSHDVGESGFGFKTFREIMDFLEYLEKWGKVVLTTERVLPSSFERYVYKIPTHRIHDLLYYANLYVGEGATMASEAGILGTPWIFVSKSGRGYLKDQEEHYALGFHVDSINTARKKSEEILSNKNSKNEWKVKREKLLNEKIDVTAFIVDFIERWPQSYLEAKRR